MRKFLPPFVELYNMRHVTEEPGAMRMNQAYALFYTLNAVYPKVVIESGASSRGLSTWIARSILPQARIISLDPRVPELILPNVTYLNGDKARDFADIDWKNEFDVNPEDALILFDDRHAAVRRMKEAGSHGFKRMIFVTNHPAYTGDHMSLFSFILSSIHLP
jgi:tRNA A58 N-methylase Trm61